MSTPFFSFVRPLAVVAFGGNALLRPGDSGTTAQQLERAREAVRHLLPILARGYELVVVHGNGPQVGNLLIQAEMASSELPPQTLDYCVALTQGSLGFLLELAFANELPRAGFRKEVATFITQVMVDAADPAFLTPTKPVGPFFSAGARPALEESVGWRMSRGRGARLAQGGRVSAAARDPRGGRGRGSHQPRPHRDRGRGRRHPGRRERGRGGPRGRGGHRQGLHGVHDRGVPLRGSLHHSHGSRESRRGTSAARPRRRWRR